MDFTFGVLVNMSEDSIISAALGANAAGKLTDKDIGKAVKLAGDSRYEVCADGNDIEGIVAAIEPHTVNAGLGFGSVQTQGRVVASNAGAAPIAVGAYVVAAAQPAVGTEIALLTTGTQTGTRPVPVKAGAGTVFKWRVIALLGGAGAVGTPILIERVV